MKSRANTCDTLCSSPNLLPEHHKDPEPLNIVCQCSSSTDPWPEAGSAPSPESYTERKFKQNWRVWLIKKTLHKPGRLSSYTCEQDAQDPVPSQTRASLPKYGGLQTLDTPYPHHDQDRDRDRDRDRERERDRQKNKRMKKSRKRGARGSKQLVRPMAPHNTTQYLSYNFRICPTWHDHSGAISEELPGPYESMIGKGVGLFLGIVSGWKLGHTEPGFECSSEAAIERGHTRGDSVDTHEPEGALNKLLEALKERNEHIERLKHKLCELRVQPCITDP